MTPMPLGLFATARRSPFLFQWEARDLSTTARSGQVGTLTRASVGAVTDSNGIISFVPNNAPRFGYVNGVFGLLMEGLATNVCMWNRDLTNAAWVKTNVTAAKDQVGVDGQPNSASSIVATAGNGTVLQAVTLTISTRNQSAYVRRITGAGVVNMTTDGGATWNAVVVTAAWTQVTFSQAAVTNPSIGFRLVTNGDKIAVDLVQNETGAFPSSAIVTGAAAAERSADAFSLPCNVAPALAGLTAYADLLDLGSSRIVAGYWDLGSHSLGVSLGCYAGSVTQQNSYWADGVGQRESPVTTSPALQDRLELMTQLVPAVTIQGTVAKNGGAPVVGVNGMAGIVTPAAFAQALLSLNKYAGGPDGFSLLKSFRLAAAPQTFAYMQAAA
jgi:hypothetical protein